MKRELTLMLTALVAGAGLATSVAAHSPGIELRTYADLDQDGIGDPISSQLTTTTIDAGGIADAMTMGPALSPKQSCDLCHDYDGITSAYHFQLGADEMVDADGDGFKDEVGEILTTEGGLLETLPTLVNLTSPGQFGGW